MSKSQSLRLILLHSQYQCLDEINEHHGFMRIFCIRFIIINCFYTIITDVDFLFLFSFFRLTLGQMEILIRWVKKQFTLLLQNRKKYIQKDNTFEHISNGTWLYLVSDYHCILRNYRFFVIFLYFYLSGYSRSQSNLNNNMARKFR